MRRVSFMSVLSFQPNTLTLFECECFNGGSTVKFSVVRIRDVIESNFFESNRIKSISNRFELVLIRNYRIRFDSKNVTLMIKHHERLLESIPKERLLSLEVIEAIEMIEVIIVIETILIHYMGRILLETVMSSYLIYYMSV